jgi:DNA-binding MarR family transcriptional regulator
MAPSSHRKNLADIELIDDLVADLPRRAALLVRLVHRRAPSRIPRGMSTILTAVNECPQRISQLAEAEGIGQPSATRMIGRLERLGLVTRTRDQVDRRVVTVSITPEGKRELADLRARFAAVLRDALGSASQEDIVDLWRGSEALQRVIVGLQSP